MLDVWAELQRRLFCNGLVVLVKKNNGCLATGSDLRRGNIYYSFLFFSFPTPIERDRLSMGKGNTMVELCSVEMALRVCR